jgi:thioredoxin 1
MIEVTSDNFEAEVLKSMKPVVIDLWAPWCAPCKMLGPVFEEVSKELTDYKFVKVNVQEEESLAKRFMVTGIPLLVIMRNGEEVGRFTGYRPKDELIAEIKEIVMNEEMNE